MIRCLAVALLATAVLLGACDGGTTDVVDPALGDARPIDAVASQGQAPVRTPAELRAATLERAHGARRGGFDRIGVSLWRNGAAAPYLVQAELPTAMRVRRPDTLTLGNSPRNDHWAREPGADSRDASDAERDELRELSTLLTAVTLLPLERCALPQPSAEPASTAAAQYYDLAQPDGSQWTICIDPAMPEVLALATGGQRIEFLEWYDSGRTLIPTLVRATRNGGQPVSWRIRFDDTDLRIDPAVFVRPLAEVTTGAGTGELLVGADPGIGKVVVEEVQAMRLLWLPDDGDWGKRMELFHGAGNRLGNLGYGNGGYPMLVHDQGADWFVVPFRPGQGPTEPVTVREGERLTELPDHREVRYTVPFGPWAERLANGRKVLAQALADHPEWQTTEPLWVAINLFGADPVNNRSELDQRVLTLSHRLTSK